MRSLKFKTFDGSVFIIYIQYLITFNCTVHINVPHSVHLLLKLLLPYTVHLLLKLLLPYTVHHLLKLLLPVISGQCLKSQKFLSRKEICVEHKNILTAIHDQDWSVNLPSGSLQGRQLLDPFNKLCCNMKVIPQYKVIGPILLWQDYK